MKYNPYMDTLLHGLKFQEFVQPTSVPYTRVLEGPEEIIQYLPGSHVRIWYNTEPVTYDNHFHNCAELIYMYENECSVAVPNGVYTLNSGDMILIPPYMMHQISYIKPGKQFVILIDVEPLFNFGIYTSPNSTINDILLCNKENCPHIYIDVCNNITDMINSYFSNSALWEIETYSHFLKFLALIGRNSATHEADNGMLRMANSKEHYDKFFELLQYIERSYGEPLTLDDMASHVGFSKFHFIRLFKEYTGTTFYDYLTNKRIQHAKQLLASNMGITDVAFSCGFNNQTSFCRTFKKVCGCPPTEYRQNLKRKQ